MARQARIVVEGYPHHITQRGNNRQVVFKSDEDCRRYLIFIQSHSKQYGLDILAYCLMTNHVHFIAVPHRLDSLAKTFNFAHMRYSQYYNQKEKMCGHLWQGRFYSCVLSESHLYACVRYIERNPVRARMVKKPWDYPWSSARVHCGIEGSDILNANQLFDYADSDRQSWRDYIEEANTEEEVKSVKVYTLRGYVLGDDEFIKKLEKKLRRSLKVLPRGRPQKKRSISTSDRGPL